MTISQMTTPEPGAESWAHSNSPQKFDFLTQAQNEPDSFPSEIVKISWDKLSILGNLDPNRAQTLITAFCNEPNVSLPGAYTKPSI